MSLDERVKKEIEPLKELYSPTIAKILREILESKNNLEIKRLKNNVADFKEEKIIDSILRYFRSVKSYLDTSQEFVKFFGLEDEVKGTIMLDIFDQLEQGIKEVTIEEISNIDSGLISFNILKDIERKHNDVLTDKLKQALPLILEPIINSLIEVKEGDNNFSYDIESQFEKFIYETVLDKIINKDLQDRINKDQNPSIYFEGRLLDEMIKKEDNLLIMDWFKFFKDNFKQLLKESYDKDQETGISKEGLLEEGLISSLQSLADKDYRDNTALNKNLALFEAGWLTKERFYELSELVLKILFNEQFEVLFDKKSNEKVVIKDFEITPKDDFSIYREALLKLRDEYNITSNLDNFKLFLVSASKLFEKQYRKYITKCFREFQEEEGLFNSFTGYGNLIKNFKTRLESRIAELGIDWKMGLIDNLPEIIINSINDGTKNSEQHNELVMFNRINRRNLITTINNFLLYKGKGRVNEQTSSLFEKLENMLKFNDTMHNNYSKVSSIINDYQLMHNNLGIKNFKLANSGVASFIDNDIQKTIFNFLIKYEEIKNAKPDSRAVMISDLLLDYQLDVFLLYKKGDLNE